MYLKCGVQYAYRYLEGLMMPPGVAFAYGKAVHDDTAFIHTRQVDTGSVPSVSEVIDFFDDALDRHWEGVDLAHPVNQTQDGNPKLTTEAAKRGGSAVLRVYTIARAPLFDPAKVEEAFRIQIPGKPYALVGKKDLEERSGRVIDHKSTRKSPSTGMAARSDQLTIYALPQLAKAAADEWARMGEPLGMTPAQFDQHMEARGLSVDVALNFLVALKTKVKVVLDRSTRTWGAYLRLIAKADEVHEGVRKGVFHPAPEGAWWCSPHWCGFWDVCPYGGQNVNREYGFIDPIEFTMAQLDADAVSEQTLMEQLQASVSELDGSRVNPDDPESPENSQENPDSSGESQGDPGGSEGIEGDSGGKITPMSTWMRYGGRQVLHYWTRTRAGTWASACGLDGGSYKGTDVLRPGTARHRQCKRCVKAQGGSG